MRAFLLIGLRFLSAAACANETVNAAVVQAPAAAAQAPAADCGKPAAPASGPPTLTAKQVQTVLCCIDSSLKANLPVNIKFMKVLAEAQDVFDKDYWPSDSAIELKQAADLKKATDPKTVADWAKVSEPIKKALNDTPLVTASFTPGFALRADVPVGSQCQCLPGHYLLLLSCTTTTGQLYFNEQLVGRFSIDNITTTLSAVFPPAAAPTPATAK